MITQWWFSKSIIPPYVIKFIFDNFCDFFFHWIIWKKKEMQETDIRLCCTFTLWVNSPNSKSQCYIIRKFYETFSLFPHSFLLTMWVIYDNQAAIFSYITRFVIKILNILIKILMLILQKPLYYIFHIPFYLPVKKCLSSCFVMFLEISLVTL